MDNYKSDKERLMSKLGQKQRQSQIRRGVKTSTNGVKPKKKGCGCKRKKGK